MKIGLSHHSNPDIPGYWEKPSESGRKQIVTVTSFEHASQTYRAFIERNGLGSGNTCMAPIFNDAGEQIAHVSYNGRVWEGPTTTPFENRKEIPLRD